MDFRVVAGDYFAALGVPVVGRTFDATDREDGARVAMVNRTLAERYFPGESPLGRQVWVGGGIGRAAVVGVVGDVRHHGLAARPKPELYVPFRQYPHGGMTVVVRGPGDPAGLTRVLKESVYGIDPGPTAHRPDHAAGAASAARWLRSGSISCCSGGSPRWRWCSPPSACTGSSPTPCPAALGRSASAWRSAQPDVTWVARSWGRRSGPSVAGIAIGSAGAVLIGRALAPDLYEVQPHDPLTFALVALILLGAAAVACAIPARRASRVDPAIALRSE